MITRHPTRRDWFRLDHEDARPIFSQEIPGLKIEGARFRAHRNLLTLLEDPIARDLLRLPSVTSVQWDARNRRTEALGFTLRTTQHQALDFIGPRRGSLVGDDMRLGKGGIVGTPVLTPRGWRPIEALVVGDKVIGANGCPTTVTGVYPRGALPVFRVTFSDGASTVVDGEHLWAVWDHNAWHRGASHIVKQTQDFCGDLTYANGVRKWRIPMVKPIELEARNQPIDPYLLGVLLGDGSLTYGSVAFTPGDNLVPEEVRKVLPPGTRLTSSTSSAKATTWRIIGDGHKNTMLDALRALDLMGRKSQDKFVPDAYLFGSIEQRLALLQGLMDTDGEWSTNLLAFSSSSKALADAVCFLVESLGGSVRCNLRKRPVYTYKGERRIGLPSHRLTIAMPIGFWPFRARQGYTPREKYLPARTIKSIEPAGEAQVVCIAVDATDHLYVTERCIVTHNTLTAVMAHDPARGPLVVVAPLSTRGVWLGWMRRVFPGTPIGVLSGKKFDPERIRTPLVFIHYDILHGWESIRKIGTLVLDEAHLLANFKTRRSRAATLLAAWSEKVIALTGTPVWDMPPDLWSLVTMLTDGWGNRYDFCNRYGAPQSTAYGTIYTGLSNGAELKERMTEVMIRRRWIDVTEDMPAITRSVLVAEVSDAERNKLDVLAGALKSDRTNTAGNLAAYRQRVALLKAKVVCAEAREISWRREPCVIWTWHKSTADHIAKTLGGGVFVIHGDVQADERERRIEAWKASVDGVLIATMAVAQVGVDFSHARIAIFAEIDYTPAILGQAEMRTFAPHRGMDIIFVVANHIVEQRVVRALINKLSAADPLGVGAAVDAIDALRDAVIGPTDEGDLDRLLEDMLASIA